MNPQETLNPLPRITPTIKAAVVRMLIWLITNCFHQPLRVRLSIHNLNRLVQLKNARIEFSFGNTNNTALAPKPRPENLDKPANTCQGCCTLLPLLKSISERLEKLESYSCALNRLDNLESMVSSLPIDSKAIQFKMAEVNAEPNASTSTKTQSTI